MVALCWDHNKDSKFDGIPDGIHEDLVVDRQVSHTVAWEDNSTWVLEQVIEGTPICKERGESDLGDVCIHVSEDLESALVVLQDTMPLNG